MKTLKILLAVGLLLNFFIYSFILYRTFQKEENSPLTAVREVVGVEEVKLGDVVSEALSGSTGDYAVYIKNLKTGEMYELQTDKKYNTASLFKLWVMSVTFEKIDEGTLSFDTQLASEGAILSERLEISSDSASFIKERVEMPVGQALEDMITVSGNFSALLLQDAVRPSEISSFLRENGFSGSSFSQPPTSNARDIGLFFEKLENREFTYSEEMIALLKKQTINDRIPKNLPQELEIAHKTGEIGGFKHDAGVVYAPFGKYVIVVLSNSNDPQGAAERISIISEAVYEYFRDS